MTGRNIHADSITQHYSYTNPYPRGRLPMRSLTIPQSQR